MANLNSADILGVDWSRRARELLSGAGIKPSRKEGPSLRYERVDPMAHGEPIVIKDKNALTDPDSWLNRGLGTILENAADVILGKESGVPAVDYGASSIPGVGAASILAAGGVPGILDVAGAGELKNIAKIPKYTLEFVSKYFGEKGLKNLDNALSKYPKAGKPSVNDAVVIMREGLGGETVPAIAPYRSSNVVDDVGVLSGNMDIVNTAIDRLNSILKSGNEAKSRIAKRAFNSFQHGIDESNFKKVNHGYVALGLLNRSDMDDAAHLKIIEKNLIDHPASLGEVIQHMGTSPLYTDDFVSTLRRYKELEESPVQDWDKIVNAQLRRDAKDAEKIAKREAKNVQSPVAAPEPEVVPEHVAVPAVENQPTVVTNEPSWVSWTPSKESKPLYDMFGSNLDRESKRDLYVLDSLASHWANRLKPEAGFSSAKILSGLDRADARHRLTDYDYISKDFVNDLKKNIETGNMPGTAVKFEQKYKRNRPANGVSPTLILKVLERPKYINSSRIWADEANGPDLYEAIFRPKIDKKLHEANPYYWEY